MVLTPKPWHQPGTNLAPRPAPPPKPTAIPKPRNKATKRSKDIQGFLLVLLIRVSLVRVQQRELHKAQASQPGPFS